jgi:hypothetical protein
MARQRREDGVGWKGNVVMRDSETKEVIYDNRDVVAMAKQSVLRGGPAASTMDKSDRLAYINQFEDKFFMEEWTCPHCKGHQRLYKESIYVGTIHPTDDTKTPYVRCWNCTNDSPPLEYKSEEHKIKCELMYPLANKFVNIHVNNYDAKYELIQEWIKENNFNTEQ